MNNRTGRKVASLVWRMPPGELHEVQAAVLEGLGFGHAFFLYNQPIPTDADFVFIQGPYGPLLPFIKNLMKIPRSSRPGLAYWFQQSLDIRPFPKLRQTLTPLFSELQRHQHTAGPRQGFYRLTQGFFSSKGKRLGYLGDIVWLHQQGLLDILALSSSLYQDLLAQYGISSLVVPRGYHPAYGTNRQGQRDIAAVWMGKLRTRRRRRAVHGLRQALAKRGQKMPIFDGVENPFVFGDERTEILNRAWFVPNIYFSDPTNELSIRFYIAAANGAVVISEPLSHDYPFAAGEHLVESTIEAMPDQILSYIKNERAWRKLSVNMLNHMQNELRLEESVATIMAEAERAAAAR